MNFVNNGSVITLIKEKNNFSESIERCQAINSQLLDINTVNVKLFVAQFKAINKVPKSIFFRIKSFSNNLVKKKCFGLFTKKTIKSETLENIIQTCAGDRYFEKSFSTFCQSSSSTRTTTSTTNILSSKPFKSGSSDNSLLIITIITAGVIILFCCWKMTHRRSSKISGHELQKIESVSLINIFIQNMFKKLRTVNFISILKILISIKKM